MGRQHNHFRWGYLTLIITASIVPVAAWGATASKCVSPGPSEKTCYDGEGKLIDKPEVKLPKGCIAPGPSDTTCYNDAGALISKAAAPAPKPVAKAPAKPAAKAAPAKKAPAKKAPEVKKELAPAVAAAPVEEKPAVSPSVGTYNPDLTAAELNSTFVDFGARMTGSEPNTQVKLYGLMFNDCKKYFQFWSSEEDPEFKIQDEKGATCYGFRISDPTGNGRRCQMAHKERKDSCAEIGCTGLSKLETLTSMDLSKVKTSVIGLIGENPNSELNPKSCEPIVGGKFFVHKGREIMDLELAQIKEAEKQQKIETLQMNLASCRGSESELKIAKRAKKELSKMGALLGSDLEAIDRELAMSELIIYAKKIDRAGPDELEELREKLGTWAADNPDHANKAAMIFHKIALKYVSSKNAGPEAFDQAASVIEEAQALDGLSDDTAKKLANYQTDIAYGKVESVARMGMNGNFMFEAYYRDLMTKLNRDVYSAKTMEGRMSALMALKKARQLPQKAQMVDQQNYQMEMSLQRDLYQATYGMQQNMMGQQGPQGMNGLNGMNGMGMQQPYGAGPTPYPMSGPGGYNSGMMNYGPYNDPSMMAMGGNSGSPMMGNSMYGNSMYGNPMMSGYGGGRFF